jgi:hypothetical protein
MYCTDYYAVLSNYSREIRILIFSIICIEDVARPKYFRVVERLYSRLLPNKLISTGIMQVQNKGPLTDIDSVIKGAAIVSETYAEAMRTEVSKKAINLAVARAYNGADDGNEYYELMKYFIPASKKMVKKYF